MTDSVGAGSGGGIHPGAPIIWPVSKQSQQVQQAQQAQQAGQATSVPAQAAKETSVTEAIAQKAQTAQAASQPTVARALSKTDISTQLVQLGLSASKENVAVANNMLQHGLELSTDNFNNLFKMMKGKGAGSLTQKSAMIALTKGLEDQPGAVKSLETFFGKNPQISKQMQTMQTALASFRSAIFGGKNLLSPQLSSQLIQLVANMDDKFKKLLNGDTSKESITEQMMRDGSVKDLGAFKSLLMGIAKKLNNVKNPNMAKEAKQLGKSFLGMARHTDEMLQNLTAQSILSKPGARQDVAMPDKFAYWQIPNALAETASSIEILIKRDESKKNKEINPNKTQIIIKIETEELGEITIIIEIEDKKIWYVFNNDSEAVRSFINQNSVVLKERMGSLNWDVKGIQAVSRKVDLKKFLVPTINVDRLKRVSAEV